MKLVFIYLLAFPPLLGKPREFPKTEVAYA
jgi:hypothetical protein